MAAARVTAPAGGARSLAQFRYYDFFLHAFVVVLILSNLVAPKIVAAGPFRLSGAQLLFPLTYIFGDIFTEVYGYSGSRKAIWMGFFASALLAVLGMVIVALPPAPGWEGQAAYAQIFGFVPRLVVASLIAYWVGEFANSFVLARLKVKTRGKHLWMRTVSSTIVGQFFDTLIVIVIAFGGSVDAGTLWKMIYSGYLFKVAYEAAATPLTYAVVNTLKRAEGVDIYDERTDFNPFKGVV
jgi:queuosine precursor transporter